MYAYIIIYFMCIYCNILCYEPNIQYSLLCMNEKWSALNIYVYIIKYHMRIYHIICDV